jgi:hypothetical protein
MPCTSSHTVPINRSKRPRPNPANPSDLPTLDDTTRRIWTPILSVLANITQREEPNEAHDASEEPADILGEALARKCLHLSMKPFQYAEDPVGPTVTADLDEDFMVIDGGNLGRVDLEDERALAVQEEQTYRFAVNIWLVALWTSGIEGIEGTSGSKRKRADPAQIDLAVSRRCRVGMGRQLVETIMEPLLSRSDLERPGR